MCDFEEGGQAIVRGSFKIVVAGWVFVAGLAAGLEVRAAQAAVELAQAVQTLPTPLEPQRRGGEVSANDRERARRECARVAQRRGFSVEGTTPARAEGDRRVRLRMDLRQRGERWVGDCFFDARERRAELDARRVERDRRRDREAEAGRGRGGSVSASRVRDACIREATANARTQLVAAGRVERRSGNSAVMAMTLNVEGNERRVRCFYDGATGAVTIR